MKYILQAEGWKFQDGKGVSFHNFAAKPTRLVVWPTRHGYYGGYITQRTEMYKEDTDVEVYRSPVASAGQPTPLYFRDKY